MWRVHDKLFGFLPYRPLLTFICTIRILGLSSVNKNLLYHFFVWRRPFHTTRHNLLWKSPRGSHTCALNRIITINSGIDKYSCFEPRFELICLLVHHIASYNQFFNKVQFGTKFSAPALLYQENSFQVERLFLKKIGLGPNFQLNKISVTAPQRRFASYTYGLESYLKDPEKRGARNRESYMKDLEKSRADSARSRES